MNFRKLWCLFRMLGKMMVVGMVMEKVKEMVKEMVKGLVLVLEQGMVKEKVLEKVLAQDWCKRQYLQMDLISSDLNHQVWYTTNRVYWSLYYRHQHLIMLRSLQLLLPCQLWLVLGKEYRAILVQFLICMQRRIQDNSHESILEQPDPLRLVCKATSEYHE